MARRGRNKNFNIAAGVAQLGALALLAAMFVPGVRELLLGFVIILVGLGMLALAVFLFIRVFRHPDKIFDGIGGFDTGNYSSPPSPTTWEDRASRPESYATQPPADLIQQLRAIDWFQFEKIVALTYQKLGYSVNPRGGANPDGGIDLVIEKTGHKRAVQCKQWKKWNVGVKPVREFLGALTNEGIRHGVFVTSGGYTSEAKSLADKHGIEMLNAAKLAEMLESVDAKSDPEVLALLNDEQKYCPKCEQTMILRTAKKGLGYGNQFWGCSAYPRCRFTMQLHSSLAKNGRR